MSRYRIELSDEDRLELERRASALTLPFRVVQRARLILYAAEGLADKEIRCAAIAILRSSASGDEGSANGASRDSRTSRVRVARAVFPPQRGGRGRRGRVRAARQ